MTTKTIPTYLEDERRKRRDAQLHVAEETARIQLHHGHHRAAKQAKPELPSSVGAAAKGKTTTATAQKKPRVVGKTATQGRKVA